MSTRLDKETSANLSDILAAASLSAKKVAGALRSSDRPSIALIKDGAKLIELIRKLQGEELSVLVESERTAVKSAIENWGELLREFCRDSGLPLGGAFPDFIVAGTVYVRIQLPSLSVIVNDKKLGALPPEAVLKEIKASAVEMAKGISTADIVSVIWSAYSSVVREKNTEGRLSTRRASIFELLPKIAVLKQDKSFFRDPVREKYTSYSIHNLRADFFTLMQSDAPLEHLGQRLVFEPTSVAEEGLFMFVPTLQRCAYIGHVTFVGAER
jgi:hypothetical protein